MTASCIVRAKKIHAMDPDKGHDCGCDAIVVRDGVIEAVGAFDELKASSSAENLPVVDVSDSVVLPGFMDAHMHPLWGLDMTSGIDLHDVHSADDLVAALRKHAEAVPEGWIVGNGLSFEPFEGGPVSNDLVHKAVGDRLVYISMFDAHSALVSDSALKDAQLSEPMLLADGSQVVADANGKLTGHLLEFGAMNLVESRVVRPPVAQRAQRAKELFEAMAASGLTMGHVMDFGFGNHDEILNYLEERGDLPMHLRFYPWCQPQQTDEEVQRIIDSQKKGGRRWRIEGVKFFMDGTIDGGTAYLERPDRQGQCRFTYWKDAELYEKRVRTFHEAGIPTATHAIGDRGVRLAAEVISRLPAGGPRHRIEHIETVADDVVELMAKNGIGASMQPTHCTLYVSPDGTDSWSVRLDSEQASRGWRIGDLARAGVDLALGSDWPVADYEPLPIMADAQLRHRHDDPEGRQIGIGQQLDIETTVCGYTRCNAVVTQERFAGSIAPGQRADFTVLAKDPFDVTPQELAHVPVVMTIVEGDVVVDKR